MRKHALTYALPVLLLSGFVYAKVADSILQIPPTKTCEAGFESGRKVDNSLTQLTGALIERGQTQYQYSQFSDPAPPYFTADGAVEIYGPGDYFIRYPSEQEFNSGGCFQKIPLEFLNAHGHVITNTLLQPWDVRKVLIRYRDGRSEEVLTGSVMSPSHGRVNPKWPEDNPSRRIFLFHANEQGQWIREAQSIAGQIPEGWLGHSYGGNFLQENSAPNTLDFRKAGRIGFFYERVTDVTDGFPFTTELFVQPVDESLHASGDERPVLLLSTPAFPSTRRVVGGSLVEGPRPFAVQLERKTFYLVAFSAGDYPTDSYSINFVWSESLFGPYRPLLTSNGRDLRDFSQALKKDYRLSWLGRPSPYVLSDGSLHLLFHGVIKDLVPDFDYSIWPEGPDTVKIFRLLFETNLNIQLGVGGTPEIQVGN